MNERNWEFDWTVARNAKEEMDGPEKRCILVKGF